jgi:hypothetical protein
MDYRLVRRVQIRMRIHISPYLRPHLSQKPLLRLVKDKGLKIQSSIIITMEQEVLTRPRRLTMYFYLKNLLPISDLIHYYF